MCTETPIAYYVLRRQNGVELVNFKKTVHS